MKKEKKFSEVPEFNDKLIDKQLELQVKFLKVVYPFLEDENTWNEGAIELRPLKRDKKLKSYVKSYNAWHMQEKDEEALKKFLKLLNGKGYCLYYSSFAFDFEKEVFKADKKPYMKGKVNNENALFTTILPMDFDHITVAEFEKEKQKLTDLGIETLDIITGNGFQSLILLDRRVTDRDILKKFTALMVSKGFKVDEALKDSARVLRMPYSFNCKAMDKSSKNYNEFSPEILPTTVKNWTEKRYHVVDVFMKIQGLPDVVPELKPLTELEIKTIPTAPINTTAKKKDDVLLKEVKTIKIESLKTVYSMLDFERLPDPVQKMLSGSQSGLRNKVSMFLIPFLRNTLGLSLQTIKQVMVLWGDRCSPRLDKDYVLSEVNRIYGYGFKGKFGAYTSELQEVYGYLEFNHFGNKNKLIIPNSIFEYFDSIPDGSVKIYIAMKLIEALDGIKEFTKKDIQRYTDVCERTVERNMKRLVAIGHVNKRRTNRRNGEEYIYYVNPYFGTTGGFTVIECAVAMVMLEKLTDVEMKLYTYIRMMIGDGNKDCWASQRYLAKKIGKLGPSSISKITDNLRKKKLITKRTEINMDGVAHSIYNLNI